jgi:hypothetical protein
MVNVRSVNDYGQLADDIAIRTLAKAAAACRRSRPASTFSGRSGPKARQQGSGVALGDATVPTGGGESVVKP